MNFKSILFCSECYKTGLKTNKWDFKLIQKLLYYASFSQNSLINQQKCTKNLSLHRRPSCSASAPPAPSTRLPTASRPPASASSPAPSSSSRSSSSEPPPHSSARPNRTPRCGWSPPPPTVAPPDRSAPRCWVLIENWFLISVITVSLDCNQFAFFF